MVTGRAYEITTTDSGVPVRLLPTERQPREDFLTLTPHELAWLNQSPTSVTDIIVHGTAPQRRYRQSRRPWR